MVGGSGAGKGTQAKQLSQHLQIPVIAVGEILRAGIANQSYLGLQAKPYVEKGELVPDEIIIQFMRQRLMRPDVSQGWILDGYPRTAFQAEELDFLLTELQQSLDWAIYLKLTESVMLKRSLNRALADDKLEIVQRRLARFQERTVPILEYYDGTRRLLTINGEAAVETVTQEILVKLAS